MSRTKHSIELCLNHLPWTLVHQKTVLQSSVNWIRSHQRCVSQWLSTTKNMNVVFKAIRHKREDCVQNSKWLIALLANCGWLSTGLFRGKTQTFVRQLSGTLGMKNTYVAAGIPFPESNIKVELAVMFGAKLRRRHLFYLDMMMNEERQRQPITPFVIWCSAWKLLDGKAPQGK